MGDGMIFSGGCQCGAVRYRTGSRPENAHLCHCRMCQKAAGNYFMPLASVPLADLTMTRGEASWFHSSDIVKRGFCSQCGTPLFFQTIGDDSMAVTLGSLDRPMDIAPQWLSDMDMAMPWFSGLADLPKGAGESDAGKEESRRYAAIRATNHQHPDHDTETWPLESQPS